MHNNYSITLWMQSHRRSAPYKRRKRMQFWDCPPEVDYNQVQLLPRIFPNLKFVVLEGWWSDIIPETLQKNDKVAPRPLDAELTHQYETVQHFTCVVFLSSFRYRNVQGLGFTREETSRLCRPSSLCPDLNSPATRTVQATMDTHRKLRQTISNVVLQYKVYRSGNT